VLEFRCGWFGVVFVLQASSCKTDITPTQTHRNSNKHRTKNNTTNVEIQQNSRKILMIDILMSETCWAHKKWTKIASDIKLVFYSSNNTMMHGPINIRKNRVLFDSCLWKGSTSTVRPHSSSTHHTNRKLLLMPHRLFLHFYVPRHLNSWLEQFISSRGNGWNVAEGILTTS